MTDTPIPDDLVFTTRGPGDEEDAPPGPPVVMFTLDGEVLTAHRPKQAALVLLARAGSARSGAADKIDAVARFLDLALEEDSRAHVLGRLEDPKDEFGWGEIADIVYALAGRWAPESEQPKLARKRAALRSA